MVGGSKNTPEKLSDAEQCYQKLVAARHILHSRRKTAGIPQKKMGHVPTELRLHQRIQYRIKGEKREHDSPKEEKLTGRKSPYLRAGDSIETSNTKDREKTAHGGGGPREPKRQYL